ncbi:MAG: DEAD/DEAH box helicase family protein [Cyanobacteria bacterium NC_groundwater_1444_Ag_S-0.65um_54_12]|nr:DEAD/DEAH box helicase family protein [Cyanobacteria bacterium NC_groundwater_1444_Ag_S-0.65um_54_12]
MAGLIINSPYEEPARHWHYDRPSQQFILLSARRPAGYLLATPGSRNFADPGIFVAIALVNQLRARVKAWRTDRENPYAGVSGITRRLLAYWHTGAERQYPFFFAQLEAIETLIWLTEAPLAQRLGVQVPSDGGKFARWCVKMATGTGKTVVMAMLIAWQILNKLAYGQDKRFSKSILVVAPGLTVKNRLQSLRLAQKDNYYERFDIVPPDLRSQLHQGRVMIHNWQALSWDGERQFIRRNSVDKRGPKSDEAYAAAILKDAEKSRNLLVINDEAHHAWRMPASRSTVKLTNNETANVTKWIASLDRIHSARGIRTCFDFSATPFIPSGKENSTETIFDWIVSDFSLNDAIEAGLVKTPRMLVRHDGCGSTQDQRRFYQIYHDPEVKNDLKRRAKPHEPLPELVVASYHLLGKDWLETDKAWKAAGQPVPPVMITIANRTETAARVKYAFDHGKIGSAELCVPDKTLHIDSRVLEQAEAQTTIPVLQEQAEWLRCCVNTIGQAGEPGESIQNVISVKMLSEGWDARTVTHIIGLRAFSSQLLCEQVVGRGLRRMSYDVDPETGLLEAEYVNIFGVPFTFMPHESGDSLPPPPTKPAVRIEPLAERAQLAIAWPQVIRIERLRRLELLLDFERLEPLVLADTLTKCQRLIPKWRVQQALFVEASSFVAELPPQWSAYKELLVGQLICLVEKFLTAKYCTIAPQPFDLAEESRQLVFLRNMRTIIRHVWEATRFESSETSSPVFDRSWPMRSTSDVVGWCTKEPCRPTKKSQLNLYRHDNEQEANMVAEFENCPLVAAWAKNDRLGFEIVYRSAGFIHKYFPDFLLRFSNGNLLVLAVEKASTGQDQAKLGTLAGWVEAVNNHGGLGFWQWAVIPFPSNGLSELLEQAYQGDCDRSGKTTVIVSSFYL